MTSPLSVLAGALACFLIVLVLLSANVSGHDPALQAGALRQAAPQSRGGGRLILRTSTSGQLMASAGNESVGNQAASGHANSPVTRASGAYRGDE